MSGGQPTPPILIEAFALNAPDCTAGSPIPGGKTAPFPAGSQIGITPGAASLNDGFPVQTMTAPTSGGVPPFGVDGNGILYLLSAHIAALAAGQMYQWSSTLEAAMGGYALGAFLQQAADPSAFWINLVADNTSDPDTGGSGWLSTKPLHAAVTPGSAGNQNNVVLPGPSDYIYDVTASAGALTYTGFVAQRDGQRLVIRKVDASGNAVSLASLSGSSSAANQLQIVSAGISLPVQFMSITLQYNATLDLWVQV
jgi:hypothetical protein